MPPALDTESAKDKKTASWGDATPQIEKVMSGISAIPIFRGGAFLGAIQ
jgi:hypothetical protein